MYVKYLKSSQEEFGENCVLVFANVTPGNDFLLILQPQIQLSGKTSSWSFFFKLMNKISLKGSLEWCKKKQILKLVRWTWIRIWLHHLVIQCWSCDLTFVILSFLTCKIRIRQPCRCILGNNVCTKQLVQSVAPSGFPANCC